MAVSKAKKELIMSKLQDKFKRSTNTVYVTNTGMTVEATTKLRKECLDEGLDFYVAKRTLIKRAAAENDIELDDTCLAGAVGVIFSYDDEISPSRVAFNHSKGKDSTLAITGAVFNGVNSSKEDVMKLAELPTREVLLATVLRSMKAPISGFANVCAGPTRGFVQVLNAIAEKGK
jgi:large subunit ribosomal protein L10